MTDYQRFPNPKAQLAEILRGKATGTPRHKSTPIAKGPTGTLASPLVITLPLPPAGCWPNNANRGWRNVAKDRKWAKAITVLECRRQEVPQLHLDDATAQPVFYFADKRQRDRDGAASALKSVWDGLECYGLLLNDRHLKPLMPEMNYDKEKPRLEITIWTESK